MRVQIPLATYFSPRFGGGFLFGYNWFMGNKKDNFECMFIWALLLAWGFLAFTGILLLIDHYCAISLTIGSMIK